MLYNFIEVTLPESEESEGQELNLTILIEDIQVLYENPDQSCTIEVFRKKIQESQLIKTVDSYTRVLATLNNHSQVEIFS
jgi:hypothetical protein